MTSAPRFTFREGELFASRYKLFKQLTELNSRELWSAFDTRLERRVCVAIFRGDLDAEIAERQVSVAAKLTDPRICRLFDSGFYLNHFYTVNEMPPAFLRWATLPLKTAESLETSRSLLGALEQAHRVGVTHGELSIDFLFTGEQGTKVMGFGMSSDALRGVAASPTKDLADAAQLVAGLCARTDHMKLQKAVKSLADGKIDFSVVATTLDSPTYSQSLRSGHRPVVAAFALAVTSLLIALTLKPDASENAIGPSLDAPVEMPIDMGNVIQLNTVADFDPLGDDVENTDQVEAVYDNDPRTFWSTETYVSKLFGRIKSGVGIIAALNTPQLVGGVHVLFANEGCEFELRAAERRFKDPDRWQTVASSTDTALTSNLRFAATRSQWFLVWITSLSQTRTDRWSCSIAEIRLHAP